MSFIKYYIRPIIKHWRTTLKLLSSLTKSEEFEWAEITVDELYERLDSDQPPLLIDVRSPTEFDGGYGHIPDARLIPVLELESNFESLEPFKEKEIVTMCPWRRIIFGSGRYSRKSRFQGRKEPERGHRSVAQKRVSHYIVKN